MDKEIHEIADYVKKYIKQDRFISPFIVVHHNDGGADVVRLNVERKEDSIALARDIAAFVCSSRVTTVMEALLVQYPEGHKKSVIVIADSTPSGMVVYAMPITEDKNNERICGEPENLSGGDDEIIHSKFHFFGSLIQIYENPTIH